MPQKGQKWAIFWKKRVLLVQGVSEVTDVCWVCVLGVENEQLVEEVVRFTKNGRWMY